MAKVNFSARKDPLLRPRRTRPTGSDKPFVEAEGASDAAGPETLSEDGRRRRDGAPAPSTRPAPRPIGGGVVEEPAGVVSIAPPGAAGPTLVPAAVLAPGEDAEAPQRAGQARRARRVQTSISLPPDVWDRLDALAESAGVANGQLLTAVLTAAMPDSPATAFSAVEQLLLNSAPDDALHEERNYRLPLELRTDLDRLAKALGSSPRPQRSLLIHALVAGSTPASVDQARELITAQRIEALRASMRESTAD